MPINLEIRRSPETENAADGTTGGTPANESSKEVTRDDIFFALSSHRRRFVLDYLMRERDVVDLRTLSRELAAWENGIDPDDTTAIQRKRAYVSLHQNHLPKMDHLGLVHYDGSRGLANLTEGVEDLELYLEVSPTAEIPWGYFYLGLGATACALVTATWLGVPPFTLVPDLFYAAIVAVTFTLTAFAHAVQTNRSRIGAGDDPVRIR